MTFKGTFFHGNRSGKGITTTLEGDYFECEYENDLENGRVKKSKADGYLFEGRYRNG